MKKTKFILVVAAAVSMLLAATGCDLSIRNQYVAPETESLYVALGGENTFNVTKVNVNGTEDASLKNSALAPSAWNAVSEFIKVELKEGQYVEYTFTQPTEGANAWNSWALALFDDNNYGNFVRGDNWLNTSIDAGFESGKWNAGGSSANGTWANDFTYETCASKLPTDAVVLLRIEFDGEDVTITEKVDGTLAYTTTSADW